MPSKFYAQNKLGKQRSMMDTIMGYAVWALAIFLGVIVLTVYLNLGIGKQSLANCKIIPNTSICAIAEPTAIADPSLSIPYTNKEFHK